MRSDLSVSTCGRWRITRQCARPADPLRVTECADFKADILSYLLEREKATMVIEGFIALISNSRRSIIAAVLEVCRSFKINPETTSLAVRLLDAYLSKTGVRGEVGDGTSDEGRSAEAGPRQTHVDHRLLAPVAVMIASKSEERSPVNVGDLTQHFDQSAREISRAEETFINVLGFDVTLPTTVKFMYLFKNQQPAISTRTADVAILITQVAAHEMFLAHAQPSHDAAASLYLACTLSDGALDLNKLRNAARESTNKLGILKNKINSSAHGHRQGRTQLQKVGEVSITPKLDKNCLAGLRARKRRSIVWIVLLYVV